MATYGNIFATKWPLLDFYLKIWKLTIAIGLFNPSVESMTYQYERVSIYWGSKEIYNFRLYTTLQRKEDRLRSLINKGINYSLEELQTIKNAAEDQIKILEK